MSLFSEFKPSSAADWRKQLEKDLKGDVYNSLLWHNENGFDILPYYTGQDLKQQYQPAFLHRDWEIIASTGNKNSVSVNEYLLRSLQGGATAILLDLRELDLDTALKGIQLQFIRSAFIGGQKEQKALRAYLEKSYRGQDLLFSFLPVSFSEQNHLEAQLKNTELFSDFPKASVLGVDVAWAHHRGCHAVYELALVLAQLAEFANSGAASTQSVFTIRMGVNSDYFVQIAKLRAIRRLWLLLKDEMGLQQEPYLIAETCEWNKSISDPYTNLLRTCIEAMAAVAGGCNGLLVKGFDLFNAAESKLSQRMAINQQLILKDECYFDKMGDTACGSYFIESVTDQLAEKALEKFKDIENKGGYFNYLGSGELEKDIEVQSAERAQSIREQKTLLVGVNKFRSEKDSAEVLKRDLERIKTFSARRAVLSFELDTLLNSPHA